MPEIKLIGDEVSTACAAILLLKDRAYDLFTRHNYVEADLLFKEIERHAADARIACYAQALSEAEDLGNEVKAAMVSAAMSRHSRHRLTA